MDPSVDAADRSHSDLPEAQHQQGGEGAQDLPLPAERAVGDPTQPGLGGRYYLSADATGLSLSDGDHGLAHPQSAGLAHLEHTGGRLLRRGTERDHLPLRSARGYEHRPK